MTTEYEALRAPWPWGEVKYRIGPTAGERGAILYYVDARLVAERLDQVVGEANWSDDIEIIDKDHVLCRLTVNGVTHADVGEANDGGMADALKGATSDALKRVAVKFGIGRYLYEKADLWVDIVKRGKSTEPAPHELTTIERHYRRLIGEDVGKDAPARARTPKGAEEERAGSEAPPPASSAPRRANQAERTEFWSAARKLGYDATTTLQFVRSVMPDATSDLVQWTPAMFEELLGHLRRARSGQAA